MSRRELAPFGGMQGELPLSGTVRLKRLLVPGGFHPAAVNAAWRAALVARAHGGWLRIVHLARFGSPDAAAQRLAPLAWQLQEHMQVCVLAQAFNGTAGRELVEAAQEADLVVVHATSGIASMLRVPPLRLAQAAGRPVLVVRRPATVRYRRVLVAAPDAAGVQQAAGLARMMGDGQEQPRGELPADAEALLERERVLFPDLVVVSAGCTASLVRGFLASTEADTLLLPARDAAAEPAQRCLSVPPVRPYSPLQPHAWRGCQVDRAGDVRHREA